MTPTDEQLERWSAERVMGWEWHPLYHTLFIKSPKYKTIILENLETVEIPDPASNSGGTLILLFNWHPLADLNQTFMVVEKMREKGWDGKIDWYSAEEKVTPFHAEFWRWNPNVSASAFADNPARAIHLAMWRAMEGK